jgi:hypothetical protein
MSALAPPRGNLVEVHVIFFFITLPPTFLRVFRKNYFFRYFCWQHLCLHVRKFNGVHQENSLRMNYFFKKFFHRFSQIGKLANSNIIFLERFLKKIFFVCFDRIYTNHTYEKSKLHHENRPKINFLIDFHNLANPKLIFYHFCNFLREKIFVIFSYYFLYQHTTGKGKTHFFSIFENNFLVC